MMMNDSKDTKELNNDDKKYILHDDAALLIITQSKYKYCVVVCMSQ